MATKSQSTEAVTVADHSANLTYLKGERNSERMIVIYNENHVVKRKYILSGMKIHRRGVRYREWCLTGTFSESIEL